MDNVATSEIWYRIRSFADQQIRKMSSQGVPFVSIDDSWHVVEGIVMELQTANDRINKLEEHNDTLTKEIDKLKESLVSDGK